MVIFLSKDEMEKIEGGDGGLGYDVGQPMKGWRVTVGCRAKVNVKEEESRQTGYKFWSKMSNFFVNDNRLCRLSGFTGLELR